MENAEPPYDPEDIEDLWKALAAFDSEIPIILTSETPLPEALSKPIWIALRLVQQVREELRMNYGFEDKVTLYPPVDGGWDAGLSVPPPIDIEGDWEP